MALDPLFVTTVKVAKHPDFALLSFSAPGGSMTNGTVETTEILRLVMSYRTLAQTTELLVAALRELDAARAVQAPAPATIEQRSFGSRDGDRGAASPREEAEPAITGRPTTH